MKKILLMIMLVFVWSYIYSQINVNSFKAIENDLDAKVTNPKLDSNGDKAALIKIVTNQGGFYFETSLGVISVENHTFETWLYIPSGSKSITIKHPVFGVLKNYKFKIPIEKGTVYEMLITLTSTTTITKHIGKETQVLSTNQIEPNEDKNPPNISLINPNVSRGFKMIEDKERINVIAKTTDENGIFKVTVNGVDAFVNSDGIFQANVLLAFGENYITIKSTDTKQNSSEYNFFVIRKTNQIIANTDNQNTYTINEKRIALVIGNGAYESMPLRNPINDANIISIELKKLGFIVNTIINGTQNQIKQAISNYGILLSKDKNTVGLFYYAGHGIQTKGKNYLIPIDAKIEKEPDVEVFCVDIEGLLSNLEYAGNNMNIIILDACRNNPFGRSFRSQAGTGLAMVNAPSGTIVAFATAPGSTASDGQGNNGLYTQEFVKALQIPNLKIEDVFKKVRTQVKLISNGQQIPWENSALEGDFYFIKQ